MGVRGYTGMVGSGIKYRRGSASNCNAACRIEQSSSFLDARPIMTRTLPATEKAAW